MHLDLRHFSHPQHLVAVEVVLLDLAVLQRDRAVQRRAEPETDAAFHLGRDDVGIDRRAAIDGADNALHFHVAVLVDGDFRDLGYESLECLSDRDSAPATFRQRFSRIPACFFRGEFEHGPHARFVGEQVATSSMNASTANAVCELPTTRHHSTGTPVCVVVNSTEMFGIA
jgi:hypothetical protein